MRTFEVNVIGFNVKTFMIAYACYIKQIHVVCDEPAYMQGEYLVELQCYQHNPNL